MERRTSIIFGLIFLLCVGSLLSIFVVVDRGAQSSMEKGISNLQEKTLALSTVSIAELLTSLQPVIDWYLEDYKTGFGLPSVMNKVAFMAWATANSRFMKLGLSPYVYYSERWDDGYTWGGDQGCYVVEGDMVCLHACNTSEVCGQERTPTNASSAGYENRYYTVTYPVEYSLNWTTESFRYADDLNYSAYSYIQNIATKTIAQINGSWTPPYYFNLSDVSSGLLMEYALQTLVYPLRFDPKTGLCTYAFSIDISLSHVSKRLREARASPESTMIALSAAKDNYIIATSNTEIPAWDPISKDMWNRENHPSEIARAASKAVIDHIPSGILQNAPDGYFTKFEKEMLGKRYLVATRHLRDRDLLWIIIDVTPYDFHYKTLNDARMAMVPIVAPMAGLFAVLILVGFGYMKYQQWTFERTHTRDISMAPKGEKVALMFTDVQNSTKLWNTNKEAMAKAVKMHHLAIRKIITKHKGYEVKTIGDSFMVVHDDPSALLRIALEIQKHLMSLNWPFKILTCEDGCTRYGDEGKMLYCGLRIRIGLHYGEVERVFDEVAKGYDYYGDTVNCAARIEAVAFGGQTVCSQDFLDQVDPSLTREISQKYMGKARLKGIEQSVPITGLWESDMDRGIKQIQEKTDLSPEEQKPQEPMGVEEADRPLSPKEKEQREEATFLSKTMSQKSLRKTRSSMALRAKAKNPDLSNV